MGRIHLTLRMGQRIGLTEKNYSRALETAKQKNSVNASNTRGAGKNQSFYQKGDIGEAAILQEAGIDRGPRVLGSYDPEPDITEVTPPVEVKCGIPVEAITKITDHAIYIVLQQDRSDGRWLTVTHITRGQTIRRCALIPPENWFPLERRGTRLLNYEIPTEFYAISWCNP